MLLTFKTPPNMPFKILAHFPNSDKIHPLKQKKVASIIEQAKGIPEIKRIIIFGSSTSRRCIPDSDLDVYFELSKKVSLSNIIVDDVLDKWTNYDVDERFLEEIEKTGVVVYER